MDRLTKYLDEGSINLAPSNKKEALLLVGKFVKYLRGLDIDKTGRGYFFPRYGTVENAVGKNILINGDYVSVNSLIELVVIENKESS